MKTLLSAIGTIVLIASYLVLNIFFGNPKKISEDSVFTQNQNASSASVSKHAQPLTSPPSGPPEVAVFNPAISVVKTKLSPLIRQVLKEAELSKRNLQSFTNSVPLVRIDEMERVQVYIQVSRMGDDDIVELQNNGLEIELTNKALMVVQGWISLDRLRSFLELEIITKVSQPNYATYSQGSRLTEGDALLLANQLRARGVDGRGVKVGVLSDGASDASRSILTGDLPEISTYGSCALRSPNASQCSPRVTCNEGTAILEIIHDIAPGAELAIASVSTSLEFINNLNVLADDFGADIIVDDIGFFGEPYFEDGPVARAVSTISERVLYITSAGNSGDGHLESQFLSKNIIFDGDPVTVHDFGLSAGRSTDHTVDVIVEPGGVFLALMQWNDRFGSSSNDYDIGLYNSSETDLVCETCFSFETQTGNSDPFEAFCYNNATASPVSGKLAVNKFDGQDKRFEVFMLGTGFTTEYNEPAGSIFGHAGLPSTIAVGAINASDPGSNNIQPYSSRGPSRIDFPNIQSRPKPDLVAFDGVSVTGNGGFPTTFFGTSASAPHAAGVAALAKQLVPRAIPSDLRVALQSSTIDKGLAGFDSTFGFGLLQAPKLESFVLGPAFQFDSDGDGVPDSQDFFPMNPDEQFDADNDGLGDNADQDDDNDGVPDIEDAFPFDPNESKDSDQDGIGNNEDTDDNGDGLLDIETEPNNDLSSADPLGVSQEGSISSSGDADWYYFDVTVPQLAVVGFATSETFFSDRWEVGLYSGTGDPLFVNEFKGPGVVFANIQTPGRYFVKITSSSSISFESSRYFLDLSLQKIRLDIEIENNDSSKLNNPLITSYVFGQTHDGDDADFFLIDVLPNTALSVSIDTEDPSFRGWTISLFDLGGNLLASGNRDGGDEGIFTGVGENRAVIVSVSPESSFSPNLDLYTLRVICGNGGSSDCDGDGVEDSQDFFALDASRKNRNDLEPQRYDVGETVRLPLLGRVTTSVNGLARLFPTGATAASLNVTAVTPDGPGFITVYPCGVAKPNASNLNFVAGDVVPNGVIAPVGTDGAICLYSSQATDLIVDVAGWFEGEAFVGATPQRLVDTRDGTGGQLGQLVADAPLVIQTTGISATTAAGSATTIPTTAGTVALNVTVVNPDSPGFITVYPCDAPRPLASNLNYVAGQVVANGVLAPVSSTGQVCLYSQSSTDIIVDLAGWFPGNAFTGATPNRLVDTRDGTGAPLAKLQPSGQLSVAVQGSILSVNGNSAQVPLDASAAALNVTVVNPESGGFVTVWPCSAARPNASNLNFTAGRVVANNVVAPIGDQGNVCFFASQNTDIIVDISGYFTGESGNQFVGSTPKRFVDTRDGTGPAPQ